MPKNIKNNVEIIAEIAQGFEGNKFLAQLLLDGFLKTDADIVKFQLVFADELCTKSYQHYKLYKKLEMSRSVWSTLVKKTHKYKKKIYFDIYGEKSLKIARSINADGVKISTADFYNTDLIRNSFKNFKNILISITGREFKDIIDILKLDKFSRNITLLHGIQSEPTSINENNLLKITMLRHKFSNVKIGFMDHSIGNSEESFYLPLVALGVGIDSIEKHLTLDRELRIEDYVSALGVKDFIKFVKIIRFMQSALGVQNTKISKKEKEYVDKAGKFILAKQNLKKNTKILKKHIHFKRTAINNFKNLITNPNYILNKIIKKDIKKGNPILTKDVI